MDTQINTIFVLSNHAKNLRISPTNFGVGALFIFGGQKPSFQVNGHLAVKVC